MPFTPKGSDAFCLSLDNLLGYDVATTRRLLFLTALLHERAMTNDSWLITNGPLQQIISAPDGMELIKSGALVLGLRDSTPSFSSFLEDGRTKAMHGLCATDEFASLLDGVDQDMLLRFPMGTVGATFRDLTGRVLTSEFLMQAGVPEEDAEKTELLMKDSDGTNTYVVEQVLPKLSEGARELVGMAARSPYQISIPTASGTGIMGNPGWAGGPILDALHGRIRGRIEVGGSGDFNLKITDPGAAWLLSNHVLEHMTAEELTAARSTSNRTEYLDALASFFQAPTDANWKELSGALERFLVSASHEVIGLREQTGDPGVDEDGTVSFEGDSSLRVVHDDDTIELNSPTNPDEETIIVGRTHNVPVVATHT